MDYIEVRIQVQAGHRFLSGRIDDVVFSPSGDTVFAVGGSGGLRRSINGGATFFAFGSGLATGTRTHFDLCFTNPAYMYAAVYSSQYCKSL